MFLFYHMRIFLTSSTVLLQLSLVGMLFLTPFLKTLGRGSTVRFLRSFDALLGPAKLGFATIAALSTKYV